MNPSSPIVSAVSPPIPRRTAPARVDASEQGAQSPESSALAWWRHPMVWLVISGPLIVVVAGFWTLWVAVTNPDPIVGDTARTPQAAGMAHTPAQTARNHAATSRAAP